MSRGRLCLILAAGVVLAIGFAVVLVGCGRKEADMSSSVPPPSTRGQNVAATGPALSETLTFDRVALESAVKHVPSKMGPVYLEFTYADSDGKVYKCRLPEGMAKGEYQYEDWIRTFNIYRLPTVIKQKSGVKKPTDQVTDFPFISPRAASPSAPQGASGGPPPPRGVSAPPPPASAPTAAPVRIPSGPMEDIPARVPSGPRGRDVD